MLRIVPPIHPGEILREEFLVPLGLTPYGLAKLLRVPRTRVERLVREEHAVTADMALRLGRYFGSTAGFWLNLQSTYDLTKAEMSLEAEIAAIEPRVLEPEAA